MKILEVSRCVLPLTDTLTGGAEYFLLETSLQLARLGHEVHIVADASPSVTARLRAGGVEVHHVKSIPMVKAVNRGFYGWLGMHLWGNLAAHRKASKLIRNGRFDVVHHHGSLTQLLHRRSAKSVPTVFTVHDAGPWLGHYPKRLERSLRKVIYSRSDVRAASHADHVTVVFSALKQHLVNRWNLDPSTISVISPGVDTDLFRCGATNSRRGFLFTGHMIKRKGVDLLGPIVANNPDFHLTCVGDGPELRPLKEYARAKGIDRQFTFPGATTHTDLPEYMRNANAFVLPASSEGLPLTVLESLSSSTPVIAFDVGGIRDAVTDSWNGYLVEPRDVDNLENKMRQISDGGPNLVARLGSNGRTTVETKFSWASIARQFESSYASIQA